MEREDIILYEESNFDYLLSLVDRTYAGLFANSIGINRSTLSRWRRHISAPNRYNIGETCRFFGIAEDTLRDVDLRTHPEHVRRSFAVRM